LLAREPVDVILTDINMPGMDGGQFVGRLREDAALSAIPVVVVSTDATSERMDQMLALGARGYVTKPFSPEALRAELDRVLELADAWQRHRTGAISSHRRRFGKNVLCQRHR